MKTINVFLIVILMIFLSSNISFAYSPFYMVAGNSMYPELQNGDIAEIVSEEYQDGDMVVAMKQDGTKIVKRLMGDRLVSINDGASYSVNEITILGAAKYTPMSLAELEEYGFRWESVLAEGEYIVQVVGGYQHSLALTNTGVVYAWGLNESGQLGNGASGENRHIPVKVANGEMGNNNVTAIAAGEHHSLALKDGTVYAWGLNNFGQLGDGSEENKPNPVKVADGMVNSNVTAIAAGKHHSLALKDGTVYAWGLNNFGQLGDGSEENKPNPVKITDGVMGNYNVTAIAAGEHHSLALKDGAVYAWGLNNHGQLGDGSTFDRHTPVKVTDGVMWNNNVTAITAGGYHSLALKDGAAYAWGLNNFGQLGDGSEENKPIPVKIADGVMENNNVTAIIAGGYHSLALKDGAVYAWGLNDHGQLGDDSEKNQPTPVKIADGAMENKDVEAIGTALSHSFAIKDGVVYSWGNNNAGQLGDGTTSIQTTPVSVLILGNAQAPQITSQPIGKILAEGEQITLEVVANVNDDGTLSYQWYQNETNSHTGGTPITGATSASYSPPTDQVGTVYYYVEITNTNNAAIGNKTASVASEVAEVTVLPLVHAEAPVITHQPTGATVVKGGPSPTLTVSASINDGGTLSYQWYKNTTNSNTDGTPITGATNASYSPPTNQVGTIYYYVVVTNTNTNATGIQKAHVTSSVAVVTVHARNDHYPSIPDDGDHDSDYDDPKTPPLPVKPKPEPTQNFIDIVNHWAEKDIRIAIKKGIIQGYPDETFKPNLPMTRAELVTIVIRALGLELTGEKVFSDTRDHWAKDMIATAYEHEMISGYSDTLFGPDDFITREQMTAIIVNAFKLQQGQERKAFADEENISSWAKEIIEIATSNGILNGYEDGTFKPKNHATRAESVTILVRILERE